jgi:uncharacterized protein (TIGR02118 family)
MLKLIYCLRRKPDLSVEEFQRYWREVHAPLVAERADLLGIKRYVQAHTTMPEVVPALQERNGGSPAPYDGVAEIWIETLTRWAARIRLCSRRWPICSPTRATSSTWHSHPLDGARERRRCLTDRALAMSQPHGVG